ncbi:hypothetical protein GTGU_04177 [Trabulsiella guamensis ATCC 49490]|uniref:Fimbrial adhesin n=1 Tax=Trabulsiella guamensis ATCC 49490 TaxID=1005994 RepID=A0A084ZNY1_9ENTR|nr:pilus assembly protein [Trabulsiella guamensis]KFB99175.1 hypothetical protein GTGU_04177 [Trabulsiella guamensis ATCC 49490]
MRTLALLFTLLVALFSAPGWAVDCYQRVLGGPTDYTVTLPPFMVPVDAPPGSKIWESRDINITVYCDNAQSWSSTNPSESLFAWLMLSATNNADILDNPYFTFGVTYNGVDYTGSDIGIPTGACLDKRHDGIYDSACNGVTPQKEVTFNARFRLFIQLKAVPADQDQQFDFGKINIVQFDGEGGANLMPDAKNLRFNIDGLDNITFLDCSVDISLEPQNQVVDFGILSRSGLQTTPATQPFHLSATKDLAAGCTQSFDVETSFYDNDGALYDATHLNMGNGLLLRIADDTTHTDTRFNEYQPFETFIAGMEERFTHDYTAELTKNPSQDIAVGPFSKTVTIKINYH